MLAVEAVNLSTYRFCRFGVQIGGLLSFNVLLPSDEPDVWRLMGCAVPALSMTPIAAILHFGAVKCM
jgi:hypothetical protein